MRRRIVAYEEEASGRQVHHCDVINYDHADVNSRVMTDD